LINQPRPKKSARNVEIRAFKPEDLDQVKVLIDKTIDSSYAHYPSEFIDYWKNNIHSKNSILKDALGGVTLIVELDKRLVGTGTLLETEILRVFVDPLVQRKGIGKQIMILLEEHAKESRVKAVYLTSTAVSKPFYDRLGYVAIESKIFSAEETQVVGYYRMTKNLKQL
jgi:N-acetylglutamate synthase-like GNAT family acetyltransferase